MSFLDFLRNRNNKELKHPVSFGFSAAKWEACYRKHSDGSKEDANLHEFGLFLYRRLEKVRECLQQLESQCQTVPADDVVFRVARNLNKACLHVQAEAVAAIKDRSAMASEEIGHGRTIKSKSGAMLTQQEALETMTDAARHVLRRAIQKSRGYGIDTPVEPVWPIDDSLITATDLAQFYEGFEKQWQAALWTSAKFTYSGPRVPYVLSELDSALAIDSTIDLARRTNKYTRDFAAARKMALSPSTMKEAVLSREPYGIIGIKHLEELSDELQQYILGLAYQRFSIMEGNSAGLLNEELGTLHGLTLRKVLDGWLQIGCLACQSMMQSRTWSESAWNDKEHPAGAFPVRDLSRALQSILGVSEAQAEALLDFFTFDGTQIEQSLWQRPLLRHPEGLLMVWLPLIASHPMRLLSSWAKENEALEVEHAKRGRAFEGEVVEGLLAAAVHGSLEVKPLVFGPGLKIADQSIGDIDALLVLGDTAFVLECRNVMHPATDYEFWEAAEALKKKSEQVIRKRNYLQQNPAILSSIIENSPFAASNREIRRVVAMVVSNSYLLEGANDAEPYFFHLDTLFNTILTSGPLFGDMGPNGEEVELHANLFGMGIEPADALIRAMSKPPKAEYHRKCLTELNGPILAIEDTEPFGLFRQWTFTPPQLGTLRSLLKQCSFADNIVARAVDNDR